MYCFIYLNAVLSKHFMNNTMLILGSITPFNQNNLISLRIPQVVVNILLRLPKTPQEVSIKPWFSIEGLKGYPQYRGPDPNTGGNRQGFYFRKITPRNSKSTTEYTQKYRQKPKRTSHFNRMKIHQTQINKYI